MSKKSSNFALEIVRVKYPSESKISKRKKITHMKTQKLIGWLIAALVLLEGTCAYATVYSGECGENLTWTLNTEDSTLVISGHGAMSGMCFASQQFRDVIKNVVFPDGLTSICDYAFGENWNTCKNLQSVVLPNSVVSVGKKAFISCIGIQEVRCGKGLKSIGDSAFLYCIALRHLELSDSLEYIPDYLCYDRALEPRVTGYGDTGTPSFRQNSGQTVPKRADYHHPWREEIHTDRI
jgi:hypothetical protein